MRTDVGHTAELVYDKRGAELRLAGKALGRIEGRAVRLVTDNAGVPRELVGISEQPQKVTIRLAGRPARGFSIQPNRPVAI
jgi:hypothetical protein